MSWLALGLCIIAGILGQLAIPAARDMELVGQKFADHRAKRREVVEAVLIAGMLAGLALAAVIEAVKLTW